LAIYVPLTCGLIQSVGAIVFAPAFRAVHSYVVIIADTSSINAFAVLGAVHGRLLIDGVNVDVDQRVVTILVLAVVAMVAIKACASAHDTRALAATVINAQARRIVVDSIVEVYLSGFLLEGRLQLYIHAGDF